MAYPVAKSFAAVSGGTIHAGRDEFPAWRVGAPLNAWMEIPGTSGAGGAPIEHYSGWARVGTRLVAAASGGHEQFDNRVIAIDIGVDAPTWSLLSAASPTVEYDSRYQPDGKPISRHTRHNIQYMPGVNGGRVMLLGCRDQYSVSPGSIPATDGFNLATNTWDAGGLYPDVIGGSASVDGGACVDANGDGWANSCQRKFTAATKAWTSPLTATAAKGVRYPWALDTTRSQMFGLCYGDGWGYSTSLGVCAIRQIGNVQEQITFNASAALTQFIADVPAEAGMAYDSINDVFLFYAGNPAGRVYKITPNGSTVWDMEIFAYGAGNVMPIASVAGTQSRISYFPEYKGVVMLPTKTETLKFMRTA